MRKASVTARVRAVKGFEEQVRQEEIRLSA